MTPFSRQISQQNVLLFLLSSCNSELVHLIKTVESVMIKLEDYLKGNFTYNIEPASCSSCGHSLDIMDKQGGHKIEGKLVCGDCYFDGVGDLIDEYPIGRPMSRTN